MTTLNIKELGAKGDAVTVNTSVIQNAIDQCAADGGGKVIVPPGVYCTSTLQLKSNVELHLAAGSKLQGGNSPGDYDDFKADGFNSELCPEKTAKVLLCASYCENIAVTGTGEINGAGPAFYNTNVPDDNRFYEKPPIPRPRMVMFFRCRNVKFEDSSYIDSPCWTFWLIDCEQVNIHRIKIIGDQRMINNDGIDIDGCRNVTLSDCFIKTGDDCFILRAIQQMVDAPSICENVVMTNCVLNSRCQGIRVGCPGDNIIRNCTFSNIAFDGEGTGINVDNPKRYMPENSQTSMNLENVVFSNFTIRSQRYPIRIYVEEGLKLRKISGLSFSNFRIKSTLPCTITGSSETTIENIRFSGIDMEADGDSAIICRNCRGLKMDGVELKNLNR